MTSGSRTVTVYRFQYFDRDSNALTESEDFATEAAIREIGAIPLLHTAKVVEERWISRAGIVLRSLP